MPSHRDQRRRFLKNTVGALAAGAGVPSDVFTHNRAMEIAHTANIAMLLRRKLHWDPQRREFKDDAQANAQAIVSRPQREPWTIKV